MIEEMTEQEKLILEMKTRISRMTNADLFDAFESYAEQIEGEKKINMEYAEIGDELERRLQRTGFLPPAEMLAEIRKART